MYSSTTTYATARTDNCYICTMSTEHLKLDADDNILIKCSDGDAKIPLSWYQNSFLVEDMVNNERK